ncbi:MAG: GtrA family protein [Cyanobium sp.]
MSSPPPPAERQPAKPIGLARPRHSTLVRFLLVGGFGELLYLGLYLLVLQVTAQQAAPAIAIAGGISLLVNAVLHARVSFRVPFSGGLLLRYVAIQLLCLGLSVALGALLQRLGLPSPVIGLISGLAWTITSFVLTRRSYQTSSLRPQPAAADRPPPGSW